MSIRAGMRVAVGIVGSLAFTLACGNPPGPPPPPSEFACELPESVLQLRQQLDPGCEGAVGPGGMDAGQVFNAFQQYQVFKNSGGLEDSCAPNRFFAYPECSRFGLVRGVFVQEDWPDTTDPFPDKVPGSLHDGDTGGNLCPNYLAALDLGLPAPHAVTPMELRTDSWNGGAVHLEWQWCRHYGGMISLAGEKNDAGEGTYPPVTYSFAPRLSDEMAAMGEWIMDFATWKSLAGLEMGGHAELHEVWMYAARAQDGGESLLPGFGRAMDYRISAQFPRDITEMEIPASIPPRPVSESTLTELVCRPVSALSGGCVRAGVEVFVKGDSNPDGGTLKVKVVLPEKAAERQPLLSDYKCSEWQCGGCRDMACVEEARRNHNLCDIPGGKVAYAGVVRCSWQDPLDLWECGNCGCDDPAQLGGRISAPVVGCAPLGLNPAIAEDRKSACASVCSGFVCGLAPACRINQCRPPGPGPTDSARLLARDACRPPPPMRRVAPMGDFRVAFGPPSKIRFGHVDEEGRIESFQEVASTGTSGFAYLTVGSGDSYGGTLELGYLELVPQAFSYVTPSLLPPFFVNHTVTDSSAVMLLRARAPMIGVNRYGFAPGRLLFAVRSTHDSVPGGAELVNQGVATVDFDPVAGTFTLDGAGRDESGGALLLHLEGVVTNRPPIANAGPDRTIECSSSGTTDVPLDGRASADPDEGDAVIHYQWFEPVIRNEPGHPDDEIELEIPIAATPTASVQAELGDHRYALHAYDKHLGSDRDETLVRVVDTTPPELTLANTEVCLWPPNHVFARFSLASDIGFTTHDACDLQPSVRIISVVSSEAADAPGSGSTNPDIAFGPTTACVRSERGGTGNARSYSVTIEARDASGRAATRTFTVLVPHDVSGHPGCKRVAGLDDLEASCRQ